MIWSYAEYEKFTVINYNKEMQCHICTDREGIRHRIDLQVNGDFDKNMKPEELVGASVEVAYLIPFIEIGMFVRRIEEANDE